MPKNLPWCEDDARLSSRLEQLYPDWADHLFDYENMGRVVSNCGLGRRSGMKGKYKHELHQELRLAAHQCQTVLRVVKGRKFKCLGTYAKVWTDGEFQYGPSTCEHGHIRRGKQALLMNPMPRRRLYK